MPEIVDLQIRDCLETFCTREIGKFPCFISRITEPAVNERLFYRKNGQISNLVIANKVRIAARTIATDKRVSFRSASNFNACRDAPRNWPE